MSEPLVCHHYRCIAVTDPEPLSRHYRHIIAADFEFEFGGRDGNQTAPRLHGGAAVAVRPGTWRAVARRIQDQRRHSPPAPIRCSSPSLSERRARLLARAGMAGPGPHPGSLGRIQEISPTGCTWRHGKGLARRAAILPSRHTSTATEKEEMRELDTWPAGRGRSRAAGCHPRLLRGDIVRAGEIAAGDGYLTSICRGALLCVAAGSAARDSDGIQRHPDQRRDPWAALARSLDRHPGCP